MKKTFHSRVIPILLLTGILSTSAYFILRAEASDACRNISRFAVITRCYGSSAEQIEWSITRPMEEAICILSGIDEMTASSMTTLSRIDLRLLSETDPDVFLIGLREAVDRSYTSALSHNPAVQKPQIVNSGRNQQAFYIAAFSKPDIPPDELRLLIETEVKPSYARIPDIGEINIFGGSMPEIHVELESMKSSALGFGCSSTAALINKSDIYQPAGRIIEGKRNLPVIIDGQLKTIDVLRTLPIGPALKLSDIAHITYASREKESISRIDGEERVSIHIKCSSSSRIMLSKMLRSETEKWEEKGYITDIIRDEGFELEKSFRRIAAALIIGMAVSGLSLFLFNAGVYRIMLLSAGQPVIVISSLGMLIALGFPPDHYMLAGLSVGTGMILDSSLLVTEAIGKTDYSMKKTAPPLIFSVLSTIITLLPLLHLKDDSAGIKSFAVSLIMILSISLVLSIFFIPCFFISGYRPRRNFILPILIRCRRRILRISANTSNSKRTIVLLLFIIIAGYLSLRSMPMQLGDPDEIPVVSARIEAGRGESLISTDTKIQKLAEKVRQIEGVNRVQTTSEHGSGTISAVYNKKTTKHADMLRALIAAGRTVNGIFLYIPDDYNTETSKLSVSVTGPESIKLREISKTALSVLLENSWTADGVLHFRESPESWLFIPDREGLADIGMNMHSVADFIKRNLQGPVTKKWKTDNREIDLRVKALDSKSFSVSDLNALTIPLRGGDSCIRIDQLGSFKQSQELQIINRLNLQHCESFSFNIPKANPGQMLEIICNDLQKIELPEGYAFIPSSELIRKQIYLKKLWFSFALAIGLVFFLLIAQRESIQQAVIIMMPLPVITAVPIIVIRIFFKTLGSESIIGLIMLSGMAINNGILIFDRLNEGINNAVKSRFNGLFLTTITSIFGMIPLLFSNNTFFIRLSIVLISGLSASFLISISYYPAIIKWIKRII